MNGLAGAPDDLSTWESWATTLNAFGPWWAFLALSSIIMVVIWGPVLVGAFKRAQAGPHATSADPVQRPLTEQSKHYFHNERVDLHRLLAAESPPVIEDKVFDNCLIVGPAVIISLGQTRFENAHIDAKDIEHALYEIPVARMSALVGVVGVKNCTFRNNCRFHRVGIMGPKPVIDVLREANRPQQENAAQENIFSVRSVRSYRVERRNGGGAIVQFPEIVISNRSNNATSVNVQHYIQAGKTRFRSRDEYNQQIPPKGFVTIAARFQVLPGTTAGEDGFRKVSDGEHFLRLEDHFTGEVEHHPLSGG